MVKNNEGEFGKYIVQQLTDPNYCSSDEQKANYAKFAKRLLYMDTTVVPGAFQMNTAWYHSPTMKNQSEHSHDFPEMVGFYGSDPENPYDLGAEIEFTIEGESHILTKSSLIYMPAGVRHLFKAILKIDKPVFHFSVGVNPEYTTETAPAGG
ncbi:MAG: hypothetical protein FWG32_02470 [Oscillospiraceae bacterium]|nr:hypothetical protein [Oscillospiraceae bacterium]